MKYTALIISAACILVTGCDSREEAANPTEFRQACGYEMPTRDTFMRTPNGRISNVSEVVKTSTGFVIKVNEKFTGVVHLHCTSTHPFQGDTSEFEVL